MNPSSHNKLIVDKPEEKMRELLQNDTLVKADRFAYERLCPMVDDVVRRRFAKTAIECDPSTACEVLRECIKNITKELEQWAVGYSAMRWLWMLRRLPQSVFEGRLSTTLGYDSTLAEVISGRSPARERREHWRGENTCLAYPLEGAVVTRLARFCAGIRILSQFHVLFRWAGKGASLLFQRGRIPEIRVDSTIRGSVETYDRRLASTGRPLSRFGSVVTSAIEEDGTDQILWIQRCEPAVVPTVVPGISIAEAKTKDWALTQANFFLELLSIQKLQELVSDRRCDLNVLFTKEAAVLLYLLACAPSLLVRHQAGLYSLLRTGNLIWKDASQLYKRLSMLFNIVPDFVRQILRAASVLNSSEVLDALESIVGEAWPLAAGPVLRHERNAICVDLKTASNRLDAALQFPALQGDPANVRADHFEKEVQSVVDKSKWRPNTFVALLRGRTLVRDGKHITDIDAIGETEGTLLIVSCKSTLYSGHYDIGDYRTIRNVASNIEDAIQRWRTILDDLRGNPVGDNFDFSHFKNMIGVVCTPNIVFVDDEVLKQSAAVGLPITVSISELATWLGTADSFWAS